VSDVFRECVQELTERHLPPYVKVTFSPRKIVYPAWTINCSVRREPEVSTKFIIEAPELLPCLLVIFAHTVSPHFHSPASSSAASDLSSSLQRFFDCGSAGAREYKANGLASSIRKAYETAGLEFIALQECIDDFDILAYLVANHEVAHIYIEQLTGQEINSSVDRKAYEYLADLVAAEWMFRRYIFLTPDDDEYRKFRSFPSHAHALASNSRWAMTGVFNLLILMAAGSAQNNRGRISLDGGLAHPGGLGRFWLQQAWLLGSIEGMLKEKIGDDLWPTVINYWKEATDKLFQSGLISKAAMWQVVDESEMQTISRAAQLAEDKKIEELLSGIGFLRSRIATAREMRSKMKQS
jgi:hypothetical protein